MNSDFVPFIVGPSTTKLATLRHTPLQSYNVYHAGRSRIRRNFPARPQSADGVSRAPAKRGRRGARAARAKFTGKMKQCPRAFCFFRRAVDLPGTLVVLADVSNDLDT